MYEVPEVISGHPTSDYIRWCVKFDEERGTPVRSFGRSLPLPAINPEQRFENLIEEVIAARHRHEEIVEQDIYRKITHIEGRLENNNERLRRNENVTSGLREDTINLRQDLIKLNKKFIDSKLSVADIQRINDYQEYGVYSEGLLVVRDKYGKYGFVDEDCKEVIKCQYEDAFDYKNGFALVKKDGYYGYINKKGENIVSCKYDEILGFNSGLALVKKDGHYGYVDMHNDCLIIPCVYDVASLFNEYDTACVKKNGEIYIINKNGETIDLKLHEDGESDKYLHQHERWDVLRVSDYSDGYCVVRDLRSSYRVYSYAGWDFKRVSDFYEEAFHFSDGLAAVKKDGKWTYVHRCYYDGIIREKDDNIFDAVSDFVGGIACVEKSGKQFFINRDLKIIGWDFPDKDDFYGEIKNSKVMYSPVFVEPPASKLLLSKRPLTFFRENGNLTFFTDTCRYPYKEKILKTFRFAKVDRIGPDAIACPWKFCNGIPFFYKESDLFVSVIDIDLEKENENDGLGFIRYLKRIFGDRYFEMIFENNELKQMAFDVLENESNEKVFKEKLKKFSDSVIEFLYGEGKLKRFIEVLIENKSKLKENDRLKFEIMLNDIQDNTDDKTDKDKDNIEPDEGKIDELGEISSEFRQIAMEQKKLFDAFNRLGEKIKASGIDLDIESIMKDIFQSGESTATNDVQYTKK